MQCYCCVFLPLKQSSDSQLELILCSRGYLARQKLVCLVAQSCLTLCDPMDCSPPGSSVHGDFSGKSTETGCHALLQGIFLTQRSDPGLLHCKWIVYCLSHQGSPRILEWVAHPFSRGTSRPRNWTGVSCIAGGFFASLATQEAVYIHIHTYTHTQLAIAIVIF